MGKIKVFSNIFESDVKEDYFNNSISISEIIDKYADESYHETLVECYDAESGKTFFAPLLEEENTESVLVLANGKSVDINYVVQENDNICLIFLPTSSRAGYVWAGIGQGALVGAATGALSGFIAGSFLPGLGNVAGLIVGAIIGGVLGAITGGIIGDFKYDLDHLDSSYDSGKSGEKLPDVRGAENQLLTGNAFPFVIGKHLITPFIIGTPYTTYTGENGENAIIREVLVAGYAPLKLTDFKLDNTWLAYNRTKDTVERQPVLHGKLTGTSKITTTKIELEKNVNTIQDLIKAIAPTLNLASYEDTTVDMSAYDCTIDGEAFDTVLIRSTGQRLYKVININEYEFGGYPNTLLNYDIEIIVRESSSSDTDDGDILKYWNNNDVSLEILQQHPDKDVDYGTIYPNKVVDTDVNANLLYVIDGDITEVAQKKNIVYKNTGFINGLRTNRVQFTESCPLEFTVNLDLPNGLYGQYSSDGTTTYETIPLWVALQWRFYSDSNSSSSESGKDFSQWNNFLLSGSDSYATYTSNTKGVLATYDLTALNADIDKHRGNSLVKGVVPDTNVDTIEEFNQANIMALDLSNNPVTNVTVSYKSSNNIRTYTEISNGKYSYTISAKEGMNAGRTKEVGKIVGTNSDISACYLSIGNGINPTSIYGTLVLLASNTEISTEKYGVTIRDSLKIYEAKTNITLPFYSNLLETTRDIQPTYIITNFDINYRVIEPENYIAQSFFGKTLLNLQAYSGEDGISEIRTSFTCKLNLDSCKNIINDTTNAVKGIEVRAIRVSPCYLNMTESWGNKDQNSPVQYSDSIVWKSLVTKTFNEDKLRDLLEKQENNETDNGNEVTDSYILNNIPEKILSEADLRKLCVVAIEAKADVNGTIQSQMRSLNCIAESFSPYYNEETNEWLPANITKETGYYKPTQKLDGSPDGWEEVTKAQYEEARGNGLSWKKEVKGTNYSKDMLRMLLNTTDQLGRNVLNDSYKVYNENNAASGFLLSLIGGQNGCASLGYEDINMLSLTDAYTFCQAVIDGSTYSTNYKDEFGEHEKGDLVVTKYSANAYIYQQQKLETLINKLAICSRAVVSYDNYGRIRLIVDKKDDYAKGVINQQNCISGTNTYSWTELPAGLQFTFSDENDGYEQNQVYCWSDNNKLSNYKGQVQSYNIDYVTNPKQLWSLGRYVLACMLLQREVLTRKIGSEGEVYTLGDTVLVQDTSLILGDGSGRIQELLEDDDYIYGFITDTPYNYRAELDENQKCRQGVTILQPNQFGKSRTVTLRLAVEGSYYVKETKSHRPYNNEQGESVTEEITNEETISMNKGVTNVCIFDERVLKNKDADPSDSIDIKYKLNTNDIVMFGNIATISQKYRITKIKSENDGSFTETLAPYFDELYEYGAPLPSFQSPVQMPTAEKETFTLSETSKTINDQLSTIQSIATSKIVSITDGTSESISNPADVTSLSAIAKKDYVELKWSFTGQGLDNSILAFHIYRSLNGGTSYSEIASTTDTNYRYTYNRSTDGYLEASDFQSWKFKIIVENIGSKQSEGVECLVNSDNYGTWLLGNPIINSRVTDRLINLMFSLPYSSRERYGNVQYKIFIQRTQQMDGIDDWESNTEYEVGDIVYVSSESAYFKCTTAHTSSSTFDDTNWSHEEDVDSQNSWFVPAVNANPYKDSSSSNVNNYKGISEAQATDNDYEIRTDSYTQTMPLWGQGSKDIRNTPYNFKVVAFNEANSSIPSTATVIALCTNIADFVQGNLTQKEAIVEELSAISANVGVIKGGVMGDVANQTNFWALSDLTAEQAGSSRNIHKGEFRLGDENEYLQVTYNEETKHYNIVFKVGNFEVTSESADFTGTTYIYDDSEGGNKTKRCMLASNGITLQKKNTTTNLWESIGYMTVDSYGNVRITNEEDETELPQVECQMPDNSVVYHLDDSYVNNVGTNSENLSFEGTTSDFKEQDSPVSKKVYDNEISIPTTLKDFNLWAKSEIVCGGDYYNFDTDLTTPSITSRTSLAGLFNSNASTSWGLTASQVNEMIANDKGE